MAEFSTFAADSHQTPNVPGVRRFWKIRSKAFTASWPVLADTTTGEITSNPLTKLPAYFVPAEYIVPPNTKDGKFNNLPEVGYENYVHSFEYEMAGLGKDLMAEIMKNRNAQSVYIIQDTDEQLWLLGSSGRGLTETINGGFGKLGNDKRGLTISATSDGHAWPALPLADDVVEDFLQRLGGFNPMYASLGSGFAWSVGGSNAYVFTDEYGVEKDNAAWQIGDEVLLVKANEATPPAVHTAKSMRDGWLSGTIIALSGSSYEIQAVAFSSSLGYLGFWSLQTPRVVYNDLSIGSAPGNGYTGALAFTYTGGTLPFEAGDNVFVHHSNGTGATKNVRATFVSQVGTTVNVTAVSTLVESRPSGPPATTGYHIMLDTII